MHARIGDSTKIVIAAGGTAGHVLPAIALAHALSSRAQVTFLGGGDGFESVLVPAAGFPFEALEAQPFFGGAMHRALRIPLVLAHGVAQARARFARSRPALVVGFGGHTSVAPVLAARTLGIPCALYEANVEPGLANRVLSPCVDLVNVAHRGSRWSARHHALAVGIPIRRDLDRASHPSRRLARRRTRRILVLGGSQGSPFLNERVPDLIGELSARGMSVEVWHQAGLRADVAATRRRYADKGLAARVDGYLVDLSDAYRWADLAISAGGAGSLAELSAVALPALLVPLAKAACNHQLPNARAYAQETGALVCEEQAFDPRSLASRLHALLFDQDRYAEHSERARSMHHPGAAERLASRCLALAGGEAQPTEASLLVTLESFRRMADNDVSSWSSRTSLPERKNRARVHKA